MSLSAGRHLKNSQMLAGQAGNERARAARNLTFNIGAFLFNVCVGLWWVPYLIRMLGTEGYGLIPLATALISYMSLATIGLNFAVGTHLTVALARNDYEESSKIFNTALAGIGGVLLALTPVMVILSWNIEWLIRFPANQKGNVQTLFLLAAAAFGVSTLASPFAVSTFAKSRFDLRALITILETATRVGIVVLLFLAGVRSVVAVGWGMVAAAAVSGAGAYWTWRLLTPELRVASRDFELKKMRGLLGTSGWLILTQLGNLLFLNIDLLVINRIFGPDAGGRYAPLLQWSMLLRSLGGTVAAVFAPQVVALTAQRDLEGLSRYLRRATRMIGLLMALPIGFLVGMAEPLLTVWLGFTFAPLAPLMAWLLLPLAIMTAVIPMTGMTMALNRVKTPGLFTVGFGILNLLLALTLAKVTSLGLYSVAIAGAIILVLKEGLFVPGYAAYVAGLSVTNLYRLLFLPIVASVATAILSRGAQALFATNSWSELAAVGVAVSLLYFGLTTFFVLEPEERAFCADRLSGIPGCTSVAALVRGRSA